MFTISSVLHNLCSTKFEVLFSWGYLKSKANFFKQEFFFMNWFPCLSSYCVARRIKVKNKYLLSSLKVSFFNFHPPGYLVTAQPRQSVHKFDKIWLYLKKISSKDRAIHCLEILKGQAIFRFFCQNVVKHYHAAT